MHYGRNYSNISRQGSVRDFMKSAAEVLGSVGPITQRTFGGSVLFWFHSKGDAHSWHHRLSRDPENGRFKDVDLARILQNATEAPASAFKARGTPEVLRVIEILSILQGRKWGVCTVRLFHVVPFVSLTPLPQLNEFRKFIGLEREPPCDPSC